MPHVSSSPTRPPLSATSRTVCGRRTAASSKRPSRPPPPRRGSRPSGRPPRRCRRHQLARDSRQPGQPVGEWRTGRIHAPRCSPTQGVCVRAEWGARTRPENRRHRSCGHHHSARRRAPSFRPVVPHFDVDLAAWWPPCRVSTRVGRTSRSHLSWDTGRGTVSQAGAPDRHGGKRPSLAPSPTPSSSSCPRQLNRPAPGVSGPTPAGSDPPDTRTCGPLGSAPGLDHSWELAPSARATSSWATSRTLTARCSAVRCSSANALASDKLEALHHDAQRLADRAPLSHGGLAVVVLSRVGQRGGGVVREQVGQRGRVVEGCRTVASTGSAPHAPGECRTARQPPARGLLPSPRRRRRPGSDRRGTGLRW